MSEALISKEHFYLNASQYNRDAIDVTANIHVQDTQDILEQNADWLVHVTRFSCDAMNAIAYCEKDTSAYWEIRVLDDAMSIKETFNFVLDKDYATPQALVEAMNETGRMLLEGHGLVEAYRFQIGPEGRFRLVSPGSSITRQLFSHIQYAGTESMNALLGFEQVTQYLRFTKTPTRLYADACTYIFLQALKATDQIHTGEYQRQMSVVLLEMLNGLRLGHTTLAAPGAVISSDPSITNNWENLIDFQRMKLDPIKGLPYTNANKSSEALLPKKDSPMLCEWFDYRKAHNVRDPGFKALVTRLDWQTHNTASNAYGRTQFSKWSSPTTIVPPCNFPHYRSWGWGNFKPETDLYPFDSLFGYQITGTTSWVEGGINDGALVFWYVNSPRRLHLLNPLPLEVQVGDDVWVPDITDLNHKQGSAYHTTRGYSVHQIESIGSQRDTIRIDYPIGPLLLNVGDIRSHDLLFTNRRIPFQSRSCTWGDLLHIYHSTPEASTFPVWTIELGECHNASIGDEIYFMTNGEKLNTEPYTVMDFQLMSTANTSLQSGHSRIYLSVEDAVLPTQMTSGEDMSGASLNNIHLFVHKVNGDRTRWLRDREGFKAAATTFSYHNHQHPGGDAEEQCSAGGDKYFPRRYHQSYDRTLLHRQLAHVNQHFEAEDMFDMQELGDGTGHIVERMSQDHIDSLPTDTQIRARCRMLNLQHKEISLTLEAPPRRLVNTFSRGTVNRAEFPSPWWTIVSYQDRPLTESFILANIDDKPLLQLAERGTSLLDANGRLYLYQEDNHGSATLHGNGTINTGYGGYRPVSPIICGFALDMTDNDVTHNSCVIWCPLQTIGNSALGEQLYNPIHPQQIQRAAGLLSGLSEMTTVNAAITFDETTKPYEICTKVMANPVVSASQPVKLWGGDGDFLASARPSHIDLVFPFKQLILQSDDLNQVPEKTHNAGGMKPILSSYTLPSMWPISVDKQGKPSGGESSPFGTVYFSETGARRFHHLVKQPGGMRQFNIGAVVTYKDPDRMPKIVTLPPNGSFDAQLLFMRKVEE